MEPHVAAQRDERAVRLFPREVTCVLGFFRERAVRVFTHAHECDVALVDFGRLVHHVEDALRAGQRAHQEVCLLGELIERHRALAHEHEVRRQAADVRQTRQHEQAAYARRHGVVHIRQADDGGDHHTGIRRGFRARVAQGFVAAAEFFKVRLFVVENFLDFLPLDHLLDESVEGREVFLLLRVEFAAAAAVVEDERQHQGEEPDDDDGQTRVEHDEHDDRARHNDKALDEQRETVVERFGDGVHVVGEAAHQLAVRARIEVAQRQLLRVFEQIAADLRHDLLRGAHHELVVAERAQRARAVHQRHEEHHAREPRHVAGDDVIVDDGLEQIRAHDVCEARNDDHHGHGRERKLVPAEVGREPAQRLFRVFRAFVCRLSRHYNPAPSCCDW